jgi:elongation factor P
MLAYTDLTKGVLFIMDGMPYEVLETHFLRMQQRKAVVQTRIRNLITGKLLDRNFQASDSFEEAEIEKESPCSFTQVRASTGFTRRAILRTVSR